MKTAIPLGLLLLVGVAAVLHRASPPRAAGLERHAVEVAPREVAEGPSAPPAPAPAIPAEIAPEPLRLGGTPVDRKAPASTTAKLMALLDRELILTAHQRDTVEQILKDREGEIKACHAAIVKSGVIDIAHYEWQVGLMKETWYRKVDSLLDRAQHERFVVQVQLGFFNEGLAFTIEPGMTVLD